MPHFAAVTAEHALSGHVLTISGQRHEAGDKGDRKCVPSTLPGTHNLMYPVSAGILLFENSCIKFDFVAHPIMNGSIEKKAFLPVQEGRTTWVGLTIPY